MQSRHLQRDAAYAAHDRLLKWIETQLSENGNPNPNPNLKSVLHSRKGPGKKPFEVRTSKKCKSSSSGGF